MEFSQSSKWSHRFKTWQQHFLNMTKRRRFMGMYWCRRAGKTYTASHLILERMLRTPYFGVCAYNDMELIAMMKQIIQRDDLMHRVASFDDEMIIMDNGSYVFVSIGIVKADLVYVNNFNMLPARAVHQLVEMNKLGSLNELLISTTGGSDNLKMLKHELNDLYIDFVDWRFIIDDIKKFWTSDEEWKHELINEIGKEQFDKDYETNIEDK